MHTSAFLGAWNFDSLARKEQHLIAGRTIQVYQANGQLAEEECAQEVKAIYRFPEDGGGGSHRNMPEFSLTVYVCA